MSSLVFKNQDQDTNLNNKQAMIDGIPIISKNIRASESQKDSMDRNEPIVGMPRERSENFFWFTFF